MNGRYTHVTLRVFYATLHSLWQDKRTLPVRALREFVDRTHRGCGRERNFIEMRHVPVLLRAYYEKTHEQCEQFMHALGMLTWGQVARDMQHIYTRSMTHEEFEARIQEALEEECERAAERLRAEEAPRVREALEREMRPRVFREQFERVLREEGLAELHAQNIRERRNIFPRLRDGTGI